MNLSLTALGLLLVAQPIMAQDHLALARKEAIRKADGCACCYGGPCTCGPDCGCAISVTLTGGIGNGDVLALARKRAIRNADAADTATSAPPVTDGIGRWVQHSDGWLYWHTDGRMQDTDNGDCDTGNGGRGGGGRGARGGCSG